MGLLSNSALWDLILKDKLLHPSAAVRMNVLKAMPRTLASAQAIKDQGRVNDPDPQVRLWAMIALSEISAKLGGITIFNAYHNLDNWSKSAFDKANAGAGLADAATLPAIPDLRATMPSAVNAQDQRAVPLKAGPWPIPPLTGANGLPMCRT